MSDYYYNSSEPEPYYPSDDDLLANERKYNGYDDSETNRITNLLTAEYDSDWSSDDELPTDNKGILEMERNSMGYIPDPYSESETDPEWRPRRYRSDFYIGNDRSVILQNDEIISQINDFLPEYPEIKISKQQQHCNYCDRNLINENSSGIYFKICNICIKDILRTIVFKQQLGDAFNLLEVAIRRETDEEFTSNTLFRHIKMIGWHRHSMIQSLCDVLRFSDYIREAAWGEYERVNMINYVAYQEHKKICNEILHENISSDIAKYIMNFM
jgi:hypothetical protein